MHHARVCVNVVIGALVMLCELSYCIEFSVFGGILLFTHPVGDDKLLLVVTKYHCNFCGKLILRIIPRKFGPIVVLAGFPDRSVRVHRRDDTQMKNATRNLANSPG